MTGAGDAGSREDLIAELANVRRRLAELNVLELQHQSNEEVLRTIVHGTADVTSQDFFHSLVRQLAMTMKVRYAFVAECTDPSQTTLRAIAFWIGSKFGGSFEYTVRGTPCEVVLAGQLCYFPRSIQALFPMDADLVALGAEGYAGVPLFDSRGNTLGHLAILDDKELPPTLGEQAESILKLFSARAAAELERKAKEEALRDVIDRLQAALAAVKTLRGLLPICAWCRKVRNDDGYWSELETYITSHSDAQFTHGVCPACEKASEIVDIPNSS